MRSRARKSLSVPLPAVAAAVFALAVLTLGSGGNASPMGGGGGNGGGGTRWLPQAGRFTLSSAAFADGGQIPVAYTCSGDNLSPPLRWGGAPAATRSFTLLVVDPDAPGAEFVHWVLYDLPPTMTELRAGMRPVPRLEGGTRQGVNDFLRTGYGGPCPPPGPAHRYVFTLHAVDVPHLPVPEEATRAQIHAALAGHVLATAVLVGRFHR